MSVSPPTEPLRLYLFGSPRAEQGGLALTIRRRKGMALLIYLALTGQPHTREALATLLWPEQDSSTALANLRRDLARLRKDVGEVFVADRQQLGLAHDTPLWVDVEQFRQQLALVRNHAHLPEQPCDECLAALTDAVALYTADLLSGFTLPDSPQWDEWHFFQSEALRQSFSEALQLLIAWYIRQGEYASAIPHAQRWVALDPLEEPAHRALMRLFAWNGQHSAALRQYEEAARLLEEEMGVPPDEETEALFQQIRARQLSPPEGTSVPDLIPALPPQARYVRERRLAVGGQGEVELARDRVTGQLVVLKRLRAELGREQPEQVARFLREAEILRRLRHPNIVRLLDSFDDGGRQVIVMEYVSGGTLRDLLRRDGPLPVERVVSIGLELADALGRAHHLGIVHRDLKPGNVLLAEDGTPRLTDFGVARLEQAETRLTQTGAFVGSPAYMSPEALRGEPLDGRSDVWSLGVLLWEMLAGRRLYPGPQITPILVGILQEPVPGIWHFRAEVPAPLAILLERMLVKERDERLGSMRQVAAALEAIRTGQNLDFLTPTSPTLRTTRPATPGRKERTTPPGSLPRRPFAPVDQQIRFTHSADGTRIAYAVVGEGPPLVKVANPLTHLQYDWESPVWRHWIKELSRDHTLIRYDERGCGLSAREVTRFSINAWVEDLEAVVDHLGLERFPIIGTSQGASVAIAYAARHPERVSHLIFCGGYARGRYCRGKIPDRTEGEMLLSLIRFGWGQNTPVFRRVFASLFVPEGTPEQLDWFTELARITTNPETAALMEQAFYESDVSHLAPRITIPTLVMHPRGDAMIPFAEGQLLANLIPNARFVPLESQNHILLEDEPAWTQFLEEVRRFLSEPSPPTLEDVPDVGRALSSTPPDVAPSLLRRDTEDVAARVRAPSSPPVRLPAQATPFIGRGQELAELCDQLVHSDVQLVTLTGPGGIGKTRLAVAVAERMRQVFADGAVFVQLAPLQSPEQVVLTLAEALGVHQDSSGEPQEQLLRYLSRRRLLLVLDNFEHLLPGAELVTDILAAAPGVKVLATSRERLNLSGETLYPLAGLPFPDLTPDGATPLDAAVAEYDAARLLVEQVRRVRPSWKPDTLDYRHVARICRLVGGMPLALVLAASWAELLGLEEIADEIARSLDFLESDLRDVPDRQRSMRAVFQSSWQMLDEEERRAMARLSICRGPFSRAAAQAVAGCSLRTLRRLLDRSWLQRRADEFEVHELVRQYAAEKLDSTPGAVSEARDTHAAYYANFLKEQAKRMRGPEQQEAFNEVHRAFSQARIAWEWLVEREQLYVIVNQMLMPLYQYCEVQARAWELFPLIHLAQQGATGESDRPLRAILMVARGASYANGQPLRFESMGIFFPFHRNHVATVWRLTREEEIPPFWRIILCYTYGRVIDPSAAIVPLQVVLERLRAEADEWLLAFGLQHLALLIALTSQEKDIMTQAITLLTEALTIMEGLGDVREIGYTRRMLGYVRFVQGELPEAIREWRAALVHLEQAEVWTPAAQVRWHIGDAHLQMGDVDAAFRQYRTMSEIAISHCNTRFAANLLSKEGFEAARHGRLDHAMEVRQHSLRLAQEAGEPYVETWCVWEMGELYRLRGELDEAAKWFERALHRFNELDENPGRCFYYRGMADIARAREDNKLAQHNYERSLALAQEDDHGWAAAYARAGLARVTLALGKREEAGAHATYGLLLARERNDRAITLAALEAAAQVLIATGNQELGLEIATFVAGHPLSWQEVRRQSQQLLEAAGRPLPMVTIPEWELRDEIWQRVEDARFALTERNSAPTQKAAVSLPSLVTPFIGRQQDLEKLRDQLTHSGVRLLTITGPGGIGKTRLALVLAEQMKDAFRDGVFFVPLAPLQSPEHLVSAVADALQFRFSGSTAPRKQLLSYLSRKQLLLVLDNFEHLLEGVELVSEILINAPAIKVLATSRERLRLSSETLYLLRGLPFPDGKRGDPTLIGREVRHYDAAKLFIEQAQRVRRDFQPDTSEYRYIARICRLVRGMPLALVLAATWLELLSVEEVTDELSASLDFLETELRDVPERHRSMRAVFEGSWQRLSLDEQEVFARLSVFHGGFTREAAQAVAGANLHALRHLVNASFLSLTPDYRYEVHELLRQFGAEHLADHEEIAERHSTYYADYVAHYAPYLLDDRQGEALEAIGQDMENIRAAWRWAIEQGDIGTVEMMAHPLLLFHDYRSRFVEGFREMELARRMLEGGNTSNHSNAARVAVLAAYGFMAMRLGKLEQAQEAFSKSADAWERLPAPLPPERAADPLIGQAILALYRGEFTTAEQIGARLCKRAEQWKTISYLPYAWHIRAIAASAQGNLAVAEDAMQRAFAVAKETGDRRFMAIGHNELGEFAAQRSDFEAARQHYQMGWEIHHEFGDREGMADARGKLGELAFHSGDYQKALAFFAESRDMFQEIGDRPELIGVLDGLGRAALGLGDYEQARATLVQALNLATESGLVAQQLAILVSVGELLQAAGQHERAAEVLSVALHHSGSRHVTRERAQSALADGLPSVPASSDALEQPMIEKLVAQLAAELHAPLGTHPASGSGPGEGSPE